MVTEIDQYHRRVLSAPPSPPSRAAKVAEEEEQPPRSPIVREGRMMTVEMIETASAAGLIFVAGVMACMS